MPAALETPVPTTTTLPVNPPQVSMPAAPKGTPLSQSPAMQKARAGLQKIAATTTPTTAEADKQSKPPAESKARGVEPGDSPEGAPASQKPAEAGDPKKDAPTAPQDGKKASAWKLVESYKAKAANLERELAEARTKSDPTHNATVAKRIETAEQRVRELEDHIRYVDYTKSAEFQDKYEKPYQEAWTKAARELSELTITSEDGQSRKATIQDLVTLCNMPLGEARAMAKELFGDVADDVMAHRRTIRELSDAQHKAMEDAKKQGHDWEQVRTKARDEARQIWQEFNTSQETKWPLMQAREGDDEWNAALDRSKDFVDRWWQQNAFEPKLTAEERRAVVQNHARIRHKAIGFDMLRVETRRLKAQLAERDAELAQFKASSPTHGGGKPFQDVTSTSTDPMAAARTRLRSMAKPIP